MSGRPDLPPATGRRGDGATGPGLTFGHGLGCGGGQPVPPLRGPAMIRILFVSCRIGCI